MKKLLSLILTLALLSTMLVFGATGASAAAATVTVTADPITPDMIFVQQSTTDGVTTQTVSSMTATKSIDSRNQKQWALMRFNVSELNLESISSAQLMINSKFAATGYLYILPATAEDWNLATNAIANNNGTLPLADSDTLKERASVGTTPSSVTTKLDALKGTI